MGGTEINEHFLIIKKLTKSFGNTIAIKEISLDLSKGEVHCLLGENGAGKTTLAECIYGAYRPDEGEIFLEGKKIELFSPRDAINFGIGMVHQHFMLIPPMTVVENIIAGTESSGMLLNLDEARERIRILCINYGIELNLDSYIFQLSVGEQQWVEILKSLYTGVSLLILDEPTAVLTPPEIKKFFSIIRRMQAERLTTVLITHKLNEVMEVSDRVTVLRKGRIVTTVSTIDTNISDLAKMMVGREVLFNITKKPIQPGNPVFELRDIKLERNKKQSSLQEINLIIRESEIIGLAGVAGNGQKELFDLIIGIRKPSSGKILFKGKEISHLSTEDRQLYGIGSIPDDRIKEGSLMDFSIAENLILGNHHKRKYRNGILLSSVRIHSFAREMITNFNISASSTQQKVRLLSGGNLQKVILAREISRNPYFLVAHQPTRGLDIGSIEYVHQSLLKLREAGSALLLISNELDEIFSLSDRIVVIYKGSIVGEFYTEEADIQQIGMLMAGIKEEVS